ncbi:MAG: hypothetical protein BWY36_00640 [Candidatus Diapherotrites archaeon ADurb.Bin253]|nr:MAG: hypothetical protein BWY36_00640 [Candidatus Diapherotrites archaeon ADurb.Bin253]
MIRKIERWTAKCNKCDSILYVWDSKCDINLTSFPSYQVLINELEKQSWKWKRKGKQCCCKKCLNKKENCK